MPGMDRRWARRAQCPRAQQDLRSTRALNGRGHCIGGSPGIHAGEDVPNGLIWMIDISIGLGTGKMLAVLACDAHHHQGAPGALSLQRVHCIGVCVAPTWAGETIAEVLKRLIAQMGRPSAYLKDGGSELHKAVALLEEQGLESPCI